MTITAAIANRLYLGAAAPARAAFQRALHDPQTAQHTILWRILRDNAGSRFGRRHRFGSTNSLAEYRARVPVREYQAIAGEIELVARGQHGVLTASPVHFLEPSGGTSGASKLVPYTRELLREFSAATLTWVYDLLRERPALRGGRAYWVVTPPARPHVHSAGGVPIGMEHDSDYFPAAARMLLDRVLGVPRALSRAPDVGACRYLTLRALLALPDLAFVSVWSPSFLSRLAEALDEHWPSLLQDLDRGTLSLDLTPELRGVLTRALPARPTLARALRRRFGRFAPPRDLGALWKGLALISCWADGHAARATTAMRSRFPRVEVQPKGLLSTEGVVSFPLFAAGEAVAAVTSHFLEFIPDGASECDARTVTELDAGGVYEPVLTTSGGLYRYRTRDLVRVEGWLERVPMLRFVGRADGASDLAGEKLTPAFVEHVLQVALDELGSRPRFAMLAPSLGVAPAAVPCYRLYLEGDGIDPDALADRVDRQLRASPSYQVCRALGQLDGVRVVIVHGGERVYERVSLARGQRGGAIKPAALDRGTDWDREFGIVPPTEEAWTISG